VLKAIETHKARGTKGQELKDKMSEICRIHMPLPKGSDQAEAKNHEQRVGGIFA
jgi:hypothetical protein